jgi:hypothetical protein
MLSNNALLRLLVQTKVSHAIYVSQPRAVMI